MIDTSMNINNSELTDTKEFIKNIIPYINPSIEGTLNNRMPYLNEAGIVHKKSFLVQS